MSDQRTRLALGQNFLRNPATARAIARTIPLCSGDVVYELGAGAGILTEAIAERGASVIAIERDANLAAKLRARFRARNVSVIEADLADVAFVAPYRVIANIPFNQTALVMRRLLFSAPGPEQAVLLLQREAAEKYAGRRLSAVSLLARPWLELHVVRAVSREEFVPRPSVDAAVLLVERRAVALLSEAERARWSGFVQYALRRCRSDARGTFRNLFSNLQWRRLSDELGIAEAALLRDLSLEQWLCLFDFAGKHVPAHKLRLICPTQDKLG